MINDFTFLPNLPANAPVPIAPKSCPATMKILSFLKEKQI